jgi:hypothetical protein
MSNSGQPPSLRWISGLTEFGGHPDMPRYTMHGSSIDAIFLATPCSFAQLLCQSDASAVRELDGTKAELQLWDEQGWGYARSMLRSSLDSSLARLCKNLVFLALTLVAC